MRPRAIGYRRRREERQRGSTADTGASGLTDGGYEADGATDGGAPAPPGSPCGYQNLGMTTQIASNIQICLPPAWSHRHPVRDLPARSRELRQRQVRVQRGL